MDKQYSVEFFVSFIDAIQKLCRDYLHFEQGVELSGYLALEIDNIKKERYVLSEFVQKTGQVISESYCTKAFKTVKKLPERNTDSENMMPARVTNSKWSQRNVHIGDVTPSRYRKPTSLPPMPSSPLLHNRTHTITSSSLEEFTEAERQREQNQQPLLNKWPIQTGTASRASKRNNALDPLSDSPSHKKEKVDPSSVVNVSRQTSSEQHDVVANLTDTISMPMSDTVVIKDEDDTLVDNGDTFLRTTTGESSATHSTDKPGGHDQQSLNNFPISPHTVHDETGAGITSADEAIMDMHFKNSPESSHQSNSKVSELLTTPSLNNQNLDYLLDDKECSTTGNSSEDVALKVEFQTPGSVVAPLSYQAFLNSEFRDIKMHKCQHCDFRTEYQGNLKRHMRVHTGEFFHCSLCPRHFSDKYELSIHMQLHSGTITCRYCGEEFTSKNRRWEHERQHKRDLPPM